jgi:inhibitor of cysteine peptidase
MNKRNRNPAILPRLAVVVLSGVILACASGQKEGKPAEEQQPVSTEIEVIEVTEEEFPAVGDTDGTEFVSSGKTLTISLQGNPTTGYNWVYTGGEGIVKEVSSGYLPSTPGLVGSGGQFVFVFEGVSPGETELRFSYARPWEKATPVEFRSYILLVDNELNITLDN